MEINPEESQGTDTIVDRTTESNSLSDDQFESTKEWQTEDRNEELPRASSELEITNRTCSGRTIRKPIRYR